jgi:predicted dienelactone hydrolase
MMMLCDHYGDDTTGLEIRLIALAEADTQPGEMFPAVGDPRIDAIIPFMPGPVYPILGDGLSNIEIPVLLFRASEDTMSTNVYSGDVIWTQIGSEYKTLVTFEGADHLLVSSACSTAWQEMCHFCCSDPVWDVDRAHDLLDHFVTAYLLAELYDDEEAAAALAPDAVRFPGITYETTEF